MGTVLGCSGTADASADHGPPPAWSDDATRRWRRRITPRDSLDARGHVVVDRAEGVAQVESSLWSRERDGGAVDQQSRVATADECADRAPVLRQHRPGARTDDHADRG